MRRVLISLSALAVLAAGSMAMAQTPRTVGVIFVVHGGGEEQGVANQWDNTLQFFQYDPHNPIFKNVIWNADAWPTVVKGADDQAYANASTQLKKYAFASERMGGKDPALRYTEAQQKSLETALAAAGLKHNIKFIADRAQWIGDQAQSKYLAWPRYMYEPKVPGGSKLTYCGSAKDGGPWKGCDPERYNVDGPGERLLKQGADELVMIDMTVAGTRFWKSYDVVTMTRRMVDDWNAKNGTNIKVRWLNDITDLMTESYPSDPPGWTRSLGEPKADRKVPLAGRPNPVIEDPLLTNMMVDGVVKSFNPKVAPADTAVMFINHATREGNEAFDPKIDDTLILDARIKAELLRRYPGMKADNIVGTWMGLREPNPNIKVGGRVRSNLERTREMRGEDLGNAWMYESDNQLPGGDHRYRYWDALTMLKDRGVKHIVVIFSQIVIHSALDLVEVPNQIAKEIGWKTWLHAKDGDYTRYPKHGNPFADYWGMWVNKECKLGETATACCFEMGGCKDGRPYPPPRQTPIDRAREDVDPSLAFDVSAYGQLGYDAAKGAPSDERPVQNQYTGTWAMWVPANDDPRMGELLANEVVKYVTAQKTQERRDD
ncbi:MAG: hypothetical protein SFV19_11085 [Rhodospirillaceae bacterium]|nr:hypothetical protein [Rhodospirillaceae bacterium]